MLSLFDSRHNRRSFLQVGSLALGGLTLPWLLQQKALAASASRPVTDKSVVFLFLHGGPSQFETFDPKMDAPAEIRSTTGETRTAIPGVSFGGSFPGLAQRAGSVSVVRSFATGDASHDIKPIVGRDSFKANIGSLYAHVAGNNHPETGLPLNVLLFPRAVDPATQAGTAAFGNFASTGNFGSGFGPFAPGSDGNLQQDMKLRLGLDRLGDRRTLLRELDRMKSSLDAGSIGGLDQNTQKAFDILLGSAGEAFDLSREDPKTVSRYDTAPLVRPDAIDRKWKNYNNYVDNAKSLGKLLLLSRRLCERGCGFVTVTTNFVWDMHADENNAPVAEGMRYMGPPLDYAVSAFLDDLEARGLSDKILLVICGEMGRTPKINKAGGRDHWGNLSPLLLAGGGLSMGQVIGRSARDGSVPNTEPIGNKHLISTIMHALFDIGKLRVVRGLPRELQQVVEWAPIPGLHR